MPVAVVQETEANFTTATGTWTLNFAAAVTSGNVVVLIGTTKTGSSRTMNTPTSSGSASFSSVTSVGGTAIGAIGMWSAVENGSGNTQYQLSIASSLTSLGTLQAYELSGADGAAATSSDVNSAQASSTSPRMTSATGLTIPSGGIVLGAISTTILASWGTLTDPANFTRDFATNVGTPSSLFASSTTAGSGVTGTATVTTARAVNGVGAVWSQSGGGGSTTFRNLLTLGVG
tara:strand:- start:3133 stop:3828 length:696 start_codon:yes stop_codon:yes gene_type:complete